MQYSIVFNSDRLDYADIEPHGSGIGYPGLAMFGLLSSFPMEAAALTHHFHVQSQFPLRTSVSLFARPSVGRSILPPGRIRRHTASLSCGAERGAAGRDQEIAGSVPGEKYARPSYFLGTGGSGSKYYEMWKAPRRHGTRL